MSPRFKIGDLAIVAATTDDSCFEFPHVMKGDIVQVVSCVPRNVISNKHPEAPRVWSDCDIEASDGTVWPTLFASLIPFPGDEEGSPWREGLLATGWAPKRASVRHEKPQTLDDRWAALFRNIESRPH